MAEAFEGGTFHDCQPKVFDYITSLRQVRKPATAWKNLSLS